MVIAAIAVGVMAGLTVSGMSFISKSMHAWIFSISTDDLLSGSIVENRFLLFIAPVTGGAILGVILFILAKKRKKTIVDPIEANALYGGRLSLTDSIIVAVQNLVSNGFGASVGLEAGYTQLSGGFASKLGITLRLRREDLRVLVGCGTAGAISAAFNAPMTGAFYAFELIIGTYSAVALTPVVVSAIVATLVARVLVGDSFVIEVGEIGNITPVDYVPAILLGMFCAGVGVLLMKCVSFIEELARKSSVKHYLRPTLGGIIIGLLAIVTPQVLSAGHGALHLNLESQVGFHILLGLFLLKAVASAVSLGSGFRGGLFFASLFMGALLGKLFAFPAAMIDLGTLTPTIYATVGMSSLAVTVIGGPMTMTLLALEITGDFPITALVLAAVITSSLFVRMTFGYSFATWRFHLRGESIRSSHDVGWIRNLTVEKLMRADVKTARLSLTLQQFREAYPLGSAQRVVVVDDEDKYVGLIVIPEHYAALVEANQEREALTACLQFKTDFLLPTMNAKQAAAIFDKTQSEALAVVNNPVERRVLGQLSESHTLKRYSEELDRRRREATGDIA